MRKLLALSVAGILGAGAIAWAQNTPIYNLSGNETFLITLESGSSIRIPIDQLRNTVGISPVGAGTTVNSSPAGGVGYLVGTGAITTWHITMPNPAYKGQVFYLVNGTATAYSNVNVNATTGTQTQTLQAAFLAQPLVPASPVGWIYDYTGSKWYRIQ